MSRCSFYMGTLELLAGRAWPSPREVLTGTLAAPGFSMPIVMTTPASHASNGNLLSQEAAGEPTNELPWGNGYKRATATVMLCCACVGASLLVRGQQAAATRLSYYPDFPRPQSLTGPLVGNAIQEPGAPLPQPLAGQVDVEEYIALHHAGSWHLTLNHHASTRPKQYGGSLVPAVTACKTFQQAAQGSASAPWHCTLDLPNSFSPGDGCQLHAEGEGRTNNDASEHACRSALAQLLVRSPSQVVLRPGQWLVSPEGLLANMPGIDPAH